jgi:hypothetical protein
MATYALAMAYRNWEENEDYVQNSYRSFSDGTRRWRRKKLKDYTDHAIIFAGEYYGIFHLEEMAFFYRHKSQAKCFKDKLKKGYIQAQRIKTS